MSDPAFQPLTMSPEEWNDCTLRGRPWMIAKLKAEVLAHVRAGEALRRDVEIWQRESKRVERASQVIGKECARLQADLVRLQQIDADYAELSQAVIAGDFQYTLQLVDLQRRRSEGSQT